MLQSTCCRYVGGLQFSISLLMPIWCTTPQNSNNNEGACAPVLTRHAAQLTAHSADIKTLLCVRSSCCKQLCSCYPHAIGSSIITACSIKEAQLPTPSWDGFHLATSMQSVINFGSQRQLTQCTGQLRLTIITRLSLYVGSGQRL